MKNMLSQEPAISVLMPVYNAELYLREAIESILNQTFTDFEFIIINDGSTDSSEEIILSYSDFRIKYVKNDHNIKLIKTLNKGINLAQGKYIVRMDADDISMPERLMKQYLFLEKNPQIGLCGTWSYCIDSKNNILGKFINQTKPELIQIHLLFSVSINHPTVCAKTELFKENLFQEVLHAEDFELWCRLSKKTLLANIPEFLIKYRWHDTNVSNLFASTQMKNTNEIISKQLADIDIYPTVQELYIHRLSFTLYARGNKDQSIKIEQNDLIQTERWFKYLIDKNSVAQKYNHYALIAFLWCRWIVLCLDFAKRKAFFPSFCSYHPKVLWYLLKQILLNRKKR